MSYCRRCGYSPCRCSTWDGCKPCWTDNCPDICTALTIQNSWNVPACGGAQSILNAPGLTTLTLGTFIWNPSFGYFLVEGFNGTTGQITISNPCYIGNAAAGAIVPALTKFILSGPPALTQGLVDFSSSLVVAGFGTMTWTTTSVQNATYGLLGSDLVFLDVEVTGTTGGVADTTVLITLPLSALRYSGGSLNSKVSRSGMFIAGTAELGGTSPSLVVIVKAYDNSVWDIGAGQLIKMGGLYVKA